MFGKEFYSFVEEHENDDIHKLALQADRYPQIDIQQAIQQIQGRRIAKDKIPSWYNNKGIVYPKHLSLEQSSSEYTALYKSSLVEGTTLTDLTGGLGVDFSFLSAKFKQATYVEKQAELVKLAEHNFKALDLNNITVVNEDAVAYMDKMGKADWIYLDPARRDMSGNKTVRIEDCMPNLIEIEQLLDAKGDQVLVKLSPMLDISLVLKSLRGISDVHIVSVNNECKELLFIKNKEDNNILTYHCVNIRKNYTDVFSYIKEQEDATQITYASQLGKYLYEPNASLIKSGAYKTVAQRYNINKLHPNSHLYTSDQYLEDFNGRGFRIELVCSFNKKNSKDYLSGMKYANIATRNFPLSPEEIKKRLKVRDGGDTYLFATTLANDKKIIIICQKM